MSKTLPLRFVYTVEPSIQPTSWTLFGLNSWSSAEDELFNARKLGTPGNAARDRIDAEPQSESDQRTIKQCNIILKCQYLPLI